MLSKDSKRCYFIAADHRARLAFAAGALRAPGARRDGRRSGHRVAAISRAG
jgi:hypothetical protein